MLNRKTPETLAHTINVTAFGETFPVDVVFINRTLGQIRDKTDELSATDQGKADGAWVNRELFRFVIKSFDGVEPTQESVKQLDEEYPGMVLGVFHKFHEVRNCSVAKN